MALATRHRSTHTRVVSRSVPCMANDLTGLLPMVNGPLKPTVVLRAWPTGSTIRARIEVWLGSAAPTRGSKPVAVYREGDDMTCRTHRGNSGTPVRISVRCGGCPVNRDLARA